jgi:hypothetical protein
MKVRVPEGRRELLMSAAAVVLMTGLTTTSADESYNFDEVVYLSCEEACRRVASRWSVPSR